MRQQLSADGTFEFATAKLTTKGRDVVAGSELTDVLCANVQTTRLVFRGTATVGADDWMETAVALHGVAQWAIRGTVVLHWGTETESVSAFGRKTPPRPVAYAMTAIRQAVQRGDALKAELAMISDPGVVTNIMDLPVYRSAVRNRPAYKRRGTPLPLACSTDFRSVAIAALMLENRPERDPWESVERAVVQALDANDLLLMRLLLRAGARPSPDKPPSEPMAALLESFRESPNEG